MTHEILGRYDTDEDNNLIIKISAKKAEDIYNNFDQESSFLKKDLNREFVEYLIESVGEIGNANFVIKFYFQEKTDKELSIRITNSIKNYFEYLQELEKKKMKEQVKNSFIFILIGVFFTALAINFSGNETVVQKVISEGLMVAGWVSLWEALAIFLIKWLPFAKNLKLFNRIVDSEVKFD